MLRVLVNHLVDDLAWKPKKGVASCEKLWRGARNLRTRDTRITPKGEETQGIEAS